MCDVTQILSQIESGDPSAAVQLLPLVYDELRRLADAAALAAKNGIEVHAGHGLTFDNVGAVAAIPQVRELNIGHFLIGEAIFLGLEGSVRRMREEMDAARG